MVAPAGADAAVDQERPTVLVSGAGIAGLSLALFLSQSGKFKVRLFERAPELQPALGAHFALNGALDCLDRAALRHVWEPHYHELEGMRFRRHRSSWKVDVDLRKGLLGTAFEGKNGIFMRDEFQGALARALPEGVLECGREIVSVQQDGDAGAVRVVFADGSAAEGDILVAADGINSVVRRLACGSEHKVYSGIQMWLMIHDEPPPRELQHNVTELSGESAMTLAFSAGRAGKHVVLVARWAPEPTRADLERDSSVEFFHQLFAECGVYEAGLATEEKLRTASRRLHFGVYSMPPGAAAWSSGRVCLLGDAIHATTPFLGQGANQAVQSAYCLARLLEQRGAGDYEAVFRELHSIREPPTTSVINLSRKVADVRVRRAGEGCLGAVRRELFYMLPRFVPSLFGKQLARAWEVRV